MARIRTVKPEFWTDEKIVECSLASRLLFIGLFNFADDKGCMERSPKRIKMQVFPADTIECEPLIMELITHGLLTEYSVNGNQYLYIPGFLKHQKINRPSKSAIPLPPEFTETDEELDKESLSAHGEFNEDSVSAHESLTDGKEGKGRERNKNIERENAEERFSACGQLQTPFSAPIGKFPVLPDWRPGVDFVRQAFQWGINLGDAPGFTPEELQQFRDYWASEGQVRNQVQWEQAFARSLQQQRSRSASGKPNRREGGNFNMSQPDTDIPHGFRG